MAEILGLDGRQPKSAAQPQRAVIDILERLLTEAKAGQVQQFAFVAVYPQGYALDGYAPTSHPHELTIVIGQLEVLQATLLSQIVGVGLDG